MKILYAASEVAPFAKTGGLADVAGALPKTLSEFGHDVRVIMPRYALIDLQRHGLKPILGEIIARFPAGEQIAKVYHSTLPGAPTPVYFIDHESYFDRPGHYGENGQDYPDNAERFGFFCLAALWTVRGLDWRPDVICCNDWQTGLIPAYLRHHGEIKYDPWFGPIKTLFTIHNLAYQGLCDPAAIHRLGLPPHLYSPEGVEFYGQLNLLKAGLLYADKLTTVSPTYAEEIQGEKFGCGLHGVLQSRAKDLSGILNGIDLKQWNPAADPHIAERYGPGSLEGKAVCKAALQKKCGLPQQPRTPLIGVVSRLAEQKGFDLVEKAAKEILALGVQIVVLGTGDVRYHRLFAKLAKAHPKQVCAFMTFDNALAHQIEAGSDIFLMPSRYEPCGLNQFYSMRYGTIPVVKKTGGLADSVENYTVKSAKSGKATGFVFKPHTPKSLVRALAKAVALYNDKPKAWTALQESAMAQDFSWSAAAKQYERLFWKMCARKTLLDSTGAAD